MNKPPFPAITVPSVGEVKAYGYAELEPRMPAPRKKPHIPKRGPQFTKYGIFNRFALRAHCLLADADVELIERFVVERQIDFSTTDIFCRSAMIDGKPHLLVSRTDETGNLVKTDFKDLNGDLHIGERGLFFCNNRMSLLDEDTKIPDFGLFFPYRIITGKQSNKRHYVYQFVSTITAREHSILWVHRRTWGWSDELAFASEAVNFALDAHAVDEMVNEAIGAGILEPEIGGRPSIKDIVPTKAVYTGKTSRGLGIRWAEHLAASTADGHRTRIQQALGGNNHIRPMVGVVRLISEHKTEAEAYAYEDEVIRQTVADPNCYVLNTALNSQHQDELFALDPSLRGKVKREYAEEELAKRKPQDRRFRLEPKLIYEELRQRGGNGGSSNSFGVSESWKDEKVRARRTQSGQPYKVNGTVYNSFNMGFLAEGGAPQFMSRLVSLRTHINDQYFDNGILAAQEAVIGGKTFRFEKVALDTDPSLITAFTRQADAIAHAVKMGKAQPSPQQD